jgi:hypothetical protein
MLGGFGVLSHELSLAGHLAREVKTLSGRGQIVDVINCPRPQAGFIVSTLASQPLWRFDAVVIVVPAPSGFGSFVGRLWDSAESHLLVQELERQCSFGARAVIVGVGGESPTGLPSTVGAGNGRTCPLFDALRNVCSSSATADFVQIFGGTSPSDTQMSPASEVYRSWANIIAPSVSAALSALPGLAGSPFHASAHDKRDQGQDEGERLAAIDALGLETAEPSGDIRRIVTVLRESYGTQYAALNIVDKDRQWTVYSAGPDPLDDMALSSSFCAITITHNEPMVVPDATNDLLFADYPAVQAGTLRFYAGVPIESPSGLRIGALCVFDPAPRPDTHFDSTMLNTLAHHVETQLWDIAPAA